MSTGRVVLASMALLATTVSPAVASFPAERRVDTCQGMPATVVGSADIRKLSGTPGPDIIVSAGSKVVMAGSGDDLVCVTGPAGFVSAGSGDDVVTTSDGDFRTETVLGPGADQFTGGGRRDTVIQVPSVRVEVDRIDTGAGADLYLERSRQQLWPEGPPASSDIVDLGAGQDLASITASNLAGSLDGGPGLNSLVVYDSTDHEFLPWGFDNVGGVATFDGEPRYHWTAFRRFDFPRTGPVHFQGSDAAEVIRASEDAVGSVPILQLDMAGGDDRVVLFGFNTPVRGGRGSDSLRLLGFVDDRTRTFARQVLVDLPRGFAHVSSSGTDDLLGVENVELDGFLTVELVGSSAANRFVVGRACETTMHGAAGADSLFTRRFHACPPERAEYWGISRGVVAFGEGGNDDLTGRGTDDQLVGGTGDDTVDGQDGFDTCSAEVERNCE